MILLIQHAEAKPKEEDPLRSLSEKGKEEAQKVAKFLKGKIQIKTWYHSEKKRSQETAQIFAKEIGGEISLLEGINPLDPPDIAYKKLQEEDAISIVGHLPHLSLLIKKLFKEEVVDFQYSKVVALEKKDSLWKILWILSPSLL